MKLDRIRTRRWILAGGILAALVVLLIIVNSILAFFSKPRLTRYLRESIVNSSDSLYRLDFEEMELDLIRGRVYLSQVHLRPDTLRYAQLRGRGEGPPMLYDMRSDELEIRGLKLFRLWRERGLEIGLVRVEKPEMVLLRHTLPKDTVAKAFSFDPYRIISPHLNFLKVEAVRVSEGKLNYRKQGSGRSLNLRFDRFFLEADGLYIDSLSGRDTSRAFYTEDLRLSVRDFDFLLPDSLYTLHFGNVSLSSRLAGLKVEDLRLEPRYDELRFHEVAGRELDHIQLKIGSISTEGFDMRAFLRNEEFLAQKILIENAFLNDFLYNFKVDNRPYQQVPHLVLKNAGVALDIRELHIEDSEIIYRERMHGSNETGELTFRKLEAEIRNLTNLPSKIAEDPEIRVHAESAVMGVGQLTTDFYFPLNRNDGYFRVEGSLGRMPLEVVNPILEPAARLRIKRGTMQKLDFSFEADSSRARGAMQFYYNNLNVELLGKEGGEENMKIASTLTNLLLLNSNNPPPEGPLRTGHIQFERLKNKSIFNYLWKSLLSGFKGSLGISAERESNLRSMAELFKERRQRREQRREQRQERRQERRNE